MIAPRLTVVGHCTSTTARILCCAGRPVPGRGRIARLAWRAGAESGFVEVPLKPAPPFELGVFDLVRLPPGAEVRYGIVIAEQAAELPPLEQILQSQARRFRLLPAHRPPRIALLSCNGAFEVEDPERRYDMWRSLRREIDAGNVDLIIHAGDQVYADEVVKRYTKLARSAKDREAVLRKLTEEYRRLYVEQSWTTPEVSAVLTSCPSIMTWDDHDIDEGWGSNPSDDKPWRLLFFRAARQAFSEFQASIGCPSIDASSFACGFIHGDLAFLLVDGRSHRLYKEGRVLGEAQIESTRKWLQALPTTTRRVYLVLGIPPIHAKLATAAAILRWTPFSEPYASDLRDGWASKKNQPECAKLMKLLFDFYETHPATDLTILSGDVHVANIGKLQRIGRDGKPDGQAGMMWQVTSSGIGSPAPEGVSGWLMEKVSRPPVDLGAGVRGELMPIMPDGHDLLTRRNFALLNLDEEHGWHREGALRVAVFGEGLKQPLAFLLPSRAH
jgi:hypothetical protein